MNTEDRDWENELDDWQLLAAGIAGDSRAFGCLTKRYGCLVRKCLLQRVRGYLSPDKPLEDLVQEVWLRVYRIGSFRGFDWSKKFSQWLWGMAMNVAQTVHRRPEVQFPVTGDPDDGRSYDPPAGGIGPDAEFEKAEALNALRGCLERTPEPLRRVGELLFLRGLSFTDAARQLDCSDTNVRMRLLPRLKEALRTCMRMRGILNIDDLQFS